MAGIEDADVIVEVGGEEIENISGLLLKYQENLWRGVLDLTIIRNQKKRKINVNLQ